MSVCNGCSCCKRCSNFKEQYRYSLSTTQKVLKKTHFWFNQVIVGEKVNIDTKAQLIESHALYVITLLCVHVQNYYSVLCIDKVVCAPYFVATVPNGGGGGGGVACMTH